MQVLFAPISYPAQKTAQPLPLRLSLDGPATTERLAPVVREPQKRKAPGSLALLPIRPAELHHPAFLRVNAQPIPLEALGQDLIDPLGVAFQAVPHHKIIRKPYQKTVPVHPRSDVPFGTIHPARCAERYSLRWVRSVPLAECPTSWLVICPPSTTPTCSHIPISLRMAPSLTRFWRMARSCSQEIVSKNFAMSASIIQLMSVL